MKQVLIFMVLLYTLMGCAEKKIDKIVEGSSSVLPKSNNKKGVMNETLFKKVSDGGDISVMLQLAVKENFIDKHQFDGREKELERVALAEQKRVADKAKEIFASIRKEYRLNLSEEASFSGPFVTITLPSEIIKKLSKDSRIIFMGTGSHEQEISLFLNTN
ncbi:MAG: hypothetical protein KAG56_01185 [Sulfurovaceae bacterium]|nr:hypothetical protein [Sulfurovaceae bacterium]